MPRPQVLELDIERTPEAAPHLDEVGYRVDDLVIDVRGQRVARGGEEIALSPLSYELLLALLRAAPNLVSLNELMNRVWPGVVVSPETVSQRVKLVRQALGDSAVAPRYIAGVRGRGYRLTAAVKTLESGHRHATNGAAALAPALPLIGATALPAAHPIKSSATPAARPPNRKPNLLGRILYPALGLLVAAVLAYELTGGTSPQDTLVAEVPAFPASPAENSLAVLPFANLSGDPESEYFSDGVSEEILNRLSRSEGLRVLARTSSFAYKDSALDARKLRDLLGVRYLLEGSVRREGRQLRITAQLVDESGFRVWGESYDREITGIFAIQDEIAAAVVTSILPQVAATVPEEESYPNVEAYEHYLIGREILRKRLQNAYARASQELQRAIEIDPDFAEARAELAIALTIAAGEGNAAAALDRSQEEIDAALSLDPDLARAHAAQGLLLLSRHLLQMQPLEGPRIEAALRTALMLAPNMVDAHNWLANLFNEQGRYDDARAEWERTDRIAPLAPAITVNIAVDSADQGDVAEAERRLQRLLEVPQPSSIAYMSLVELYFSTGRLVRSNEIAKRLAWTGVGTGRVSNASLVKSYARLGLWDIAEYWQDRIEREQGAAIVGWNGRLDLLWLQGRYAEAASSLEATLQSEPATSHRTLESGTLHALAGDYAAAIRILEPVSVGHFTPGDFGIDAGHGLVWAYLQTGAPERAQPILEKLEQFFLAIRASNRLHGSGMLYMFAQNAILAGERDIAIARLRQAVGAGWRDYYRLLHDPRWQTARDDPRFKALMATVKVDIDRQRAQLERSDDADFIPGINAAIAGARRQQPK